VNSDLAYGRKTIRRIVYRKKKWTARTLVRSGCTIYKRKGAEHYHPIDLEIWCRRPGRAQRRGERTDFMDASDRYLEMQDRSWLSQRARQETMGRHFGLWHGSLQPEKGRGEYPTCYRPTKRETKAVRPNQLDREPTLSKAGKGDKQRCKAGRLEKISESLRAGAIGNYNLTTAKEEKATEDSSRSKHEPPGEKL